jgi:NAD(P)-dependent dehydrogenase (short-subunit alcohol dehydrogenase family)
MAQKTVVITGATNGIGRATAEGISRTGAVLVLACRNTGAAKETASEISAASGNQAIETVHLDLASLASVRDAAGEIRDRFGIIDVLLNNAGVFSMKRKETVDGFEMTMGVNHLGHFLLTRELLDNLKLAPAGRIINVGSDAHLHGKIDFDNFFMEKRYAGFKAYAASRLATALFTRELADRLQDTRVTANSLHPGHAATNIWNLSPAHPMVGRAITGLMRRFLISAEEGAATSIYLACSGEVEGVTGKYFDKCEPAKANPVCDDGDLRKKLWDTSADLTGAT